MERFQDRKSNLIVQSLIISDKVSTKIKNSSSKRDFFKLTSLGSKKKNNESMFKPLAKFGHDCSSPAKDVECEDMNGFQR